MIEAREWMHREWEDIKQCDVLPYWIFGPWSIIMGIVGVHQGLIELGLISIEVGVITLMLSEMNRITHALNDMEEEVLELKTRIGVSKKNGEAPEEHDL